ncbi:MAG: hypothetical protein ABIM99_03955 [Candidatus Dojkabacteria bacterium]
MNKSIKNIYVFLFYLLVDSIVFYYLFSNLIATSIANANVGRIAMIQEPNYFSAILSFLIIFFIITLGTRFIFLIIRKIFGFSATVRNTHLLISFITVFIVLFFIGLLFIPTDVGFNSSLNAIYTGNTLVQRLIVVPFLAGVFTLVSTAILELLGILLKKFRSWA